jgi:hypothetical protein
MLILLFNVTTFQGAYLKFEVKIKFKAEPHTRTQTR